MHTPEGTSARMSSTLGPATWEAERDVASTDGTRGWMAGSATQPIQQFCDTSFLWPEAQASKVATGLMSSPHLPLSMPMSAATSVDILPDVRTSSWSIRSVRTWSSPVVGCASCRPDERFSQDPCKVYKTNISQRSILLLAAQMIQNWSFWCKAPQVSRLLVQVPCNRHKAIHYRMILQQQMNTAYTFIRASRKSLA